MPAATQCAVADIERGSHETTHIDLRVPTKQDAVGIDQEHLAVGVEVAEDLTAIGSGDAVDRDGAGIGLHEVHGGLAADVERQPVDREILALLGEGEGIAALREVTAAAGDLATGRQCIRRHRCGGREGDLRRVDAGGRCRGQRHQRQTQRCTGQPRSATHAAPGAAPAFGAAAGEFGRHLEHAQPTVPDQTIDAIHSIVPCGAPVAERRLSCDSNVTHIGIARRCVRST
jgi:hypothetical protein